jgi:glycosyltransferase involved in cell wall biosynthesis
MKNRMVSVILPVYNEGKVLENNVKKLKGSLERIFDEFEIIISEDGSTDNSREIANSLKSKKVHVLNNGKRGGKGAAIKHATVFAKGNIIMFMDADLASNPENVKQLAKLFEGGAAIVIGSRYHKNSKTERTPLRLFASKGFNYLVNIMLGSKLSDHQCGFKAFRKDLVFPIIKKVESKEWFWDTELLVRAQRNGLNVVEIPIEWNEANESKFRLFQDTFQMAKSLLAFKLNS